MIDVKNNNDLPIEVMVSKFRRKVNQEGIILEARKRRYFAKPSQIRHERAQKLERKLFNKERRKKLKEFKNKVRNRYRNK